MYLLTTSDKINDITSNPNIHPIYIIQSVYKLIQGDMCELFFQSYNGTWQRNSIIALPIVHEMIYSREMPILSMDRIIKHKPHTMFLKLTAGWGDHNNDMFEKFKETMSTYRVSHVILAWDADNYKTNKILDAIIPAICDYFDGQNIKYDFSLATIRKPSLYALGWEKVLKNFIPNVDNYLKFDDPRKHTISTYEIMPSNIFKNVVRDYTYVRAIKSSEAYNIENDNHNGWLGAQHVLYRASSYFSFDPNKYWGQNYPENEFHVIPDHVVVMAFGNTISWTTEKRLLTSENIMPFTDIKIYEYFC